MSRKDSYIHTRSSAPYHLTFTSKGKTLIQTSIQCWGRASAYKLGGKFHQLSTTWSIICYQETDALAHTGEAAMRAALRSHTTHW